MNVVSVFKPNLFLNKVAIVTGGATGIGAAITQELAHLGCNVVIASRNNEKLKDAEEKFKNNPKLKGKVTAIPCNIRKQDQVENLIKSTLNTFGKLDFLVNNGGGQFHCQAENISLKGWNAVIETNLTGTFLCCQQAYKQWMMENGGVIVNIVMDLWRGYPLFSHSSAARAGVENLTKTLALEWASQGVRINSVAPGTIFSPTAAANYPDDVFGRAKMVQPTKRLGNPEEISGMVCFILSPAAAYMTGETVKVDGAQSLYDQVYKISQHDRMPSWEWSKL